MDRLYIIWARPKGSGLRHSLFWSTQNELKQMP